MIRPAERGSPLTAKLMSHGAVYTGSRLSTLLIGFLFIPLYTRVIGSEGYGLVTLLAPIKEILAMLLLQGMVGSIFRLRYDYTGADRRSLETTIVWYVAFSVIVIGGLLALFGKPLFAVILPNVPFSPFILLTIGGAAFVTFGQLAQRKLQADQRPFAFGVLMLTAAALQLALIPFFLLVLQRGALGQVEAVTLASAITGLLALVFLRPFGPHFIDGPKLRAALSYGWRIQPHIVVVRINRYLDRVLINVFLGLGATGVYTLGSNVAGLLGVVTLSLNQAYAPLFVEAMKKAEIAGGEAARRLRREVTWTAMRVVTLVGVCAVLGSSIAREALALLATEEFARSWTIVAPASASFIFAACYQVFAQALTYDKARVHLLVVVSAAGLALNFALAVWLLPRYGLMGGVAASSLASAAMALLVLWVGQRFMPLPYPAVRWLLLIGSLIVTLGAIWAVDALSLNPFAALPAKAVLAIAGLSLAWSCNGLTIRDFRNLRGLIPL